MPRYEFRVRLFQNLEQGHDFESVVSYFQTIVQQIILRVRGLFSWYL
jgi:hypothetical protein